MLHSGLASFSAEPATIFYLVIGAATFAFARFRRTRRLSRKSTVMLFSQRRSRMALDSLDLL
jgi:hypothetical protein